MKNLKVLVPLAVAVLMLVGLVFTMNTAQADQPQPAALVTPVSASVQAAPGEAAFWSSAVVTEDKGSTAVQVKLFQRTDIQYVTDQTAVAGATNTTTLKLQFSNDGVNWEDGATIATSNAADGAALSQQAVFGKYARVYADVSNTNPVTLTVIGVMK